MVGASDLAFRLLCRRHGADTCYTEMLFSSRILSDEAYRKRKLISCPSDRPLVVQLQGNDPVETARAARLVEAECACDAIDLNLGCPLPQAEEQCFGAYLLDRAQWPTVAAIVEAMVEAVRLPITCKIRLLDSVDATIEFCRMLVSSGCSLIAVHARRRPASSAHRGQRGREAADLDAIARIVDAVGVSVLANGNTSCAADVPRNLARTGAAGVMSAEGVLSNPLIFDDTRVEETDRQQEAPSKGAEPTRFELAQVALEYLRLAADYPPESINVVRGHLMWMLGKSGKGHRCRFTWLGPYTHEQLRLALIESDNLQQLETITRAALGVDASA